MMARHRMLALYRGINTDIPKGALQLCGLPWRGLGPSPPLDRCMHWTLKLNDSLEDLLQFSCSLEVIR